MSNELKSVCYVGLRDASPHVLTQSITIPHDTDRSNGAEVIMSNTW